MLVNKLYSNIWQFRGKLSMKIDYDLMRFMFEDLGMTYQEIAIYFRCKKSYIRCITKRHKKMNSCLSRKRKKLIERSEIGIFSSGKNNIFSCAEIYMKAGQIKDHIVFDLDKIDDKNSFMKYIKNNMRLTYKVNDNKMILAPVSSYKFAILVYPYLFLYNDNPVETLKALDNMRVKRNNPNTPNTLKKGNEIVQPLAKA